MSTAASKYEVVITDSAFPDATVEQERLKGLGAGVRKLQAHGEGDVLTGTRDADVILCDSTQITEAVISNLRRARAIIQYGVGYDNIDVKAATAKGLLVCHIPDFMTTEVSEHSLALILALTRRITWADRFTKEGDWQRYGPFSWDRLMPLVRMDGKTAGVVGFGRIGRQVAERLRSFGVKVLAYDPYVTKESAAQAGAEITDLQTLFERSDIISVNALLSKETYHLIGQKEIEAMKRTAILVNTSRGKIIDQRFLIEALSSRSIAGAALDVFEEEPLNEADRILKLDNVIITPHIAGTSEESVRNLRILAIEETERVLRGEAPKHPVNPEVLVARNG